MSEYEIIMYILISIGFLMTLPAVYRAYKKLINSNTIELLVEQDDGSYAKESVNLADSDLLVQKVLKAKVMKNR